MRLPHPRLGRRGTALLGFAALDIVYGFRLATVCPSRQDFYGWLDGPVPLWTWSLPWFAVAVTCLVCAVRACDRVAFAGAIGIKVLWGLLYLSGWALSGVTDGWVSAAIWLAFAWCVGVIAGWPEPVEGKGIPWTPPSP